ncbi:MAG: PAS domain S-box protein, partial [Lentimicrobium sp.]|nr:PAS domain S-box protein [Lentimicrobium sp.]
MKKQVRPLSDAAILRQKAEEQLKLRGEGTYNAISDESGLLKLIHELEVHQVELEMQNEELLIAKEKAEIVQEKYTELYDFAPSGFISLSKDGVISELNFAAARMLGKERLHLVTSNFAFFVSVETRPVFNAFFQRVFTGKIKQTCEVIIEAEGNLPIYASINGIVSQNGGFCLLTLTDISESKKSAINLSEAKERAEESDTRFRNYIQSSPTAVFLVDKHGKYTFVNNSACKLLGYSVEEMLQLSVFDMVKADHGKKNLSFRELKQTGEIINVEKILFRKDGHAIDVILDAKKLSENEYIGFVKDISERKKAEEDLRKSEEQLKAIFENSLNPILIADDAGNYHKVNKAAAKMFGYPVGKILQMNVGDFQTTISPGDARRYQEYLSKGYEIGEFDFVRPDKSRAIAHYHAVRIRENFNLSILSDITGLKEAEEALRKSEEKMRSIYSVAPAGIGVIENRVLKEVNPRFCDMLGYTREELVEKNARMLYPTQEEYELVGKEKYNQIRKKGTGK